MPRTAFYAGSFDPVTNGHIDIITRAARLFDRLVIGVGVHHGKPPLFSWRERVEMLTEEARRIGGGIEVTTFDKLAVDAAQAHEAIAIIRGLRDATDFDYEMQMAGMNGTMAPGLETVFLGASPGARHITATLVRQIAAMGGDVSPFVPAAVALRLKRKI